MTTTTKGKMDVQINGLSDLFSARCVARTALSRLEEEERTASEHTTTTTNYTKECRRRSALVVLCTQVLQQEYEQKLQTSIQLQAWWKKIFYVKKFNHIIAKKNKRLHEAASSIQRTFRGKTLLHLLRVFVERCRQAILVLQRFFRSLKHGHEERSAVELQQTAKLKKNQNEMEKKKKYHLYRHFLKKKEEDERDDLHWRRFQTRAAMVSSCSSRDGTTTEEERSELSGFCRGSMPWLDRFETSKKFYRLLFER